jgi:hypothetical protein
MFGKRHTMVPIRRAEKKSWKGVLFMRIMSSWLGAFAIDERGGLPSIYGSCPIMAREEKGKRELVRAYLRQ